MGHEKPSVAVDVDGVLIEYKGWVGPDHFGRPYPGAREFLEELRKVARVVIHTCRLNPDLNSMKATELMTLLARFLRMHGLPYDMLWAGAGKPVAAAYVDDRAIFCSPGMSIELLKDAAPDASPEEVCSEVFGAALSDITRLMLPL